jgi:hypothetical protein
MSIIEDHTAFEATNLARSCSVYCPNIVDEAAMQTGSGLWSDRERESCFF